MVLACLVGPAADATPALLKVRLLAREQLSEVQLVAADLSCDGDVSGSGARVRAVGDRVHVEGKVCRRLVAQGRIVLRAGSEQRAFSGTLHVTAQGSVLGLDAVLEPERYVAGVISAEAGAFPPSALEAQSVVSRSYALASRGRHADAGYDLCDLTHCQLYRGDGAPAAKSAADRMAGVVLMSDAGIVPAYFHAACAGATSDSQDIFGERGVRGVSDLRSDGVPLCAAAEAFEWSWEISAKELARALSLPGRGETRVVRKDAAGRALELMMLGKAVRGPQFLAEVTRRFGYQTLRSLKLSVDKRGDKLLFKGRGVGHGVGFCQAGAAALARQGKSAAEILKHYFPDATLTKR